MATEEADVAAATQPSRPAGGLVRTIGLGAGMFVLVVAAQLLTSIVGCMVMPGVMPGCSHAVEDSETAKNGKENTKGKKELAPPVYLAFDPPLVVSFNEQGAMRFLQVTAEVMARDEGSIEATRLHMPAIRNNLLNALSGRNLAELTSREGKEALRKECLAEVKRVLQANAGKDHKASIDDLYFTSFVVQ